MEKGRGDEDQWVHDSSIDYKGRTPIRSSTGVWKASLFIIAIEFSERLSYFGLSVNLIIYLTKFLRYEVKDAAKSANCWLGVTTLLAPVGGFVADAYLGRFATVLFSSLVYVLGLSLLTMSQLVPGLKPNTSLKLHTTIFFTAMYLISIGTGGHKPSLESFGADQFDDDHPTERRLKLSFFNWWNLGLCSGLLLGVTVIVYLEDTLGYGLATIILTFIMLLNLLIFLLGRPFYRFRIPQGSPLTPLFHTFAAAVANRHLSLPSTADQLYEIQNSNRFLRHTDKFRFLDKAAIFEKNQQSKRGSPATRSPPPVFELPPASVYALGAVAMIISVAFYEKLLVPFLKRATGNERGISLLKRIGTGMAFSIVGMVTAAIVERKRLRVAEAEQAMTLSMSVFWLVPQFMVLGLGDGFTIVGLQEYFYDQMPDSMKSIGIALYLSVIGAGSFLSSFVITLVDHVTGKTGKGSWFAKELNDSRLDLFYWLLAAINGVNLGVYLFVARRYSYKSVQRRVGVPAGSVEIDCGGAMEEP
ncbi:protein NRT1/ PTR FAMILY 5.7-like [Phalaenopsis equestris]|uniref:protein NRT1/ PTR FAMILY 5.7-like n=1 Tax=Phalaenopsis equestris TaxID=78828 RepID=UPI0009E32F2A|nr:protein NRT1/ PTR FAMILY 5.7-like [Phalaenopsis equestris]